MADTDSDLQTPYVFIDTQAFVKSKLDWDSRSLSKLIELVRTGHIRIVTTSITRREVSAQINEALGHAFSALSKHDVVLRQCNMASSVSVESARSILLSKFEAYMNDIEAIDAPLTGNIDAVLDSYFDRKPPFSEKKKSDLRLHTRQTRRIGARGVDAAESAFGATST